MLRLAHLFSSVTVSFVKFIVKFKVTREIDHASCYRRRKLHEKNFIPFA